MRRLAAPAAILVLLVTVLGALGAAGAPPAAATPVPVGAGPLVLDVDTLTPRIVTATGPATLVVAGTVRNVGDVVVEQLAVRVQRGDTLRTEGEVRSALAGQNVADAVTPAFSALSGPLAPGASAPLRLEVPLQGPPETTLALTRPGTYELLVNVNGVPGGGDRLRLAATRMLLPVLSLPDAPGSTGGPAPFTVLVPVTDRPRRLPTVTGEPALLTDDQLADELAPSGRLGSLVRTLAQVAPVGSTVRDGVCVAVDPALVGTAQAMARGYQVRVEGADPVPGRGPDIAAGWLAALTEATRGGCVLALPFADADLVALTRGGLGAAGATAVTDGVQLLSAALGTPVLGGVTWPVDGTLDEPTALDLVAGGTRGLVLSADAVTTAAGGRTANGVRVATPGATTPAALGDPLLTLAASGTASDDLPHTAPGPTVAASSVTLAGGPGALGGQDVLGALVHRIATGGEGTGPLGGATGAAAPVLLAPPHGWAVDGAGLAGVLAGVTDLTVLGQLAPTGLADQLRIAGGRPVGQLVYPVRAGAREVAPPVVGTVGQGLTGIAELAAAAENEPGVGANPADVFGQVSRDLLGGASGAFRGRSDDAAAFADLGREQVDRLRSLVRVVEPPGPYSLGSSDAPLLLTIANGLPVTMRVRVELASTSGLRTAPIPEQRVPPLGRFQFRVSTEVTRSGQFTVDAVVSTPDRVRLGQPSRLLVRSTAYGTITLWLTGTAGALLVVLAARRILRRVRGEPARRRGSAAPPPSAAPGPPAPPPAAMPGPRATRGPPSG